jgi:CheY-like chemotaxis protein
MTTSTLGLGASSLLVWANAMPQILQLNDHPEISDVSSLILERAGCQHLHFTDTHDALRVLYEEPVDLFVQDMDRPGMNGFELYWLIKSEQMLRDIPILIVSAYTPVVVTKATHAGITLESIDRVEFEWDKSALSAVGHIKNPNVLYVEGYLRAPSPQEFLAAIEGILQQCSESLIQEERATFYENLWTRLGCLSDTIIENAIGIKSAIP